RWSHSRAPKSDRYLSGTAHSPRGQPPHRARISLPSPPEISVPFAREILVPFAREILVPFAREIPVPSARVVVPPSVRQARARLVEARQLQLAIVRCARRGRCAGQPIDALRRADGAWTSGGNRRTSPRLPALPALRLDQISVARRHWKEGRATRQRQQ